MAESELAGIIGANLRHYAHEKGLSQREIADQVGATPSQVSHWFAGSYEPRKYLRALAELLCDGDVSALYRQNGTAA